MPRRNSRPKAKKETAASNKKTRQSAKHRVRVSKSAVMTGPHV